MANYPKGKLTVSGAANVLTDFNPSAFYANNGNYLKFVVYVDWTNSPMLNAYLFSGEREWFTVENYTNGGIYFNMGTGGTGLGINLATNTQEFEKPMTVILNNGVASFEQDGNTASVSFSALTPTTFTLWRTNNGYNFRGSFYGFEVYDRDGNMAHNYIPWQDANNTPCVVDAVTDNVFYPTGTNYQLVYESLVSFYPSQDTFTFNANGGTQTFTVTADYAWTAVAPSDFTVSPLSGSAGDTTVTITAPMRLTSKTNTVTFTDSDTNTFDITITQSDQNITPNLTMYRGSTTIKKMYYGTDLVYRKMAHSPSLTLSVDNLAIDPNGGSGTFTVTTDGRFTVSTEDSWLTLSTSGTTVTVTATSTSANRSGSVLVTATNGFVTKTATVAVNQSVAQLVSYIHTQTLEQDSNALIDTGITLTLDTYIRIKGKYKGFRDSIVWVGWYDTSLPDWDNNDWRIFNVSNTMYFDCNTRRVTGSKSLSNGTDIDFTMSNYSLYDNNTSSYIINASQYDSVPTNATILVGVGFWWLQELEIIQGGVTVFDGKAAVSGSDIGLFDTVSNQMITNPDLTMAYEPL